MNPSTFPATNRSTQKNIWKTTTKGNLSSKKPNLHHLTLYWTAVAPTKTLHFVMKKNPNGIEQVGRGGYFFWYVSGIFFSKLLSSNFAKKWGHLICGRPKSQWLGLSHVRWSMDDPGFPMIRAKLVGRSNLYTRVSMVLRNWIITPI